MNQIIIIAITIQIIIVTLLDIKTKKIHKIFPILNLIHAILFFVILNETYVFTPKVFVLPVLCIIIGFGLYLVNIMGAGDSKYLATLFLLIPEANHQDYFILLVYSTIMYSLSLILVRLLANKNAFQQNIRVGNIRGAINLIIGIKNAYAPVILIAWLLFIRKTL